MNASMHNHDLSHEMWGEGCLPHSNIGKSLYNLKR